VPASSLADTDGNGYGGGGGGSNSGGGGRGKGAPAPQTMDWDMRNTRDVAFSLKPPMSASLAHNGVNASAGGVVSLPSDAAVTLRLTKANNSWTAVQSKHVFARGRKYHQCDFVTCCFLCDISC
jgi:hypothetical protein